jgi:hypothetical protein
LLTLTGFSGCLAGLMDEVLEIDTQSTRTFFIREIANYAKSAPALSILRTVLESLQTYHLPAEIALKSIEQNQKEGIEIQYTTLIRFIDEHLSGANDQAAITGEPYCNPPFYQAIVNWANTFLRDSEEGKRILPQEYAFQKSDFQKYVYQKLFVVLFHVSRISPGPGVYHAELTWLAAKSILTFGNERLCICKGIMLSLFLKHAFKDQDGEWRMIDIRPLPETQTMWDGFLLERTSRAKKEAINKYMKDLIMPAVSNAVALNNPSDLLLKHVHDNFINEMIIFVSWADNFRMRLHTCEQLLDWTTSVWDWLFQSYDSTNNDRTRRKFIITREKFKNTMDRRITRFRDSPQNRPATEGSPAP